MGAQQNLKELTESGIFAAILVVMALLGVYLPLLGIISILLWAVPLTIMVVRRGLRWAILSLVVSCLLIGMLIAPNVAIQMAISFAPTGLALGYGIRRGDGASQILARGVCVSVCAKVASLIVLFWFTGVMPFVGQFDAMEESLTKTQEMYASLGMSASQIEQSTETFQNNMVLIRQMVPLIILMMGALDTVMNFFASEKVLQRLKGSKIFSNDGYVNYDFALNVPEFAYWKFPSWVFYGFILSMAGLYFGKSDTTDFTMIGQIAVNLNMAMTILGLIEGVSIIQFLAKHYRINSIFKTILIVIVFFNGFLTQILTFTGILDTIFDYRKKFLSKKK